MESIPASIAGSIPSYFTCVMGSEIIAGRKDEMETHSCGRPWKPGESFCSYCGGERPAAKVVAKESRPPLSRIRSVVVLAGGLTLIVSGLLRGLQEATNLWSLRSLGAAGTSDAAQSVPAAIRHFATLTTATGCAIALLGLLAIFARKIFRMALMLSATSLSFLLGIFQVFAYVSARHRDVRLNEIARNICDYCSAPYPHAVSHIYLAVSCLMLAILLVSGSEALSARHRVTI